MTITLPEWYLVFCAAFLVVAVVVFLIVAWRDRR